MNIFSPFAYFSIFSMFIIGISIVTPHSIKANPKLQKKDTIWFGIVKKLRNMPPTFFLHNSFSFSSQAEAAGDYETAKSFIAIDEDSGAILEKKDTDTSFDIASLTKIMSSVVALDLVKPTDEITISKKATTVPPTTIGVVAGQKMTVAELLHSMLMTSANDAAQALADGINAKYHENIFIKAMNEKATFLGLHDSFFSNPEGFDDGQNRSSSKDLALLASYTLTHYPVIADIVQQPYLHIPASALHKQFDLYNWNGLLGVYPGVTGMKIGNTAGAGYTTIVSATREGHSVLIVLLGAPGLLQRDMWASELLDSVFSNVYRLQPAIITPTNLENKYSTWV